MSKNNRYLEKRASQNGTETFHVADKQKHMTSTIVRCDFDVRTLRATHGQKRSFFCGLKTRVISATIQKEIQGYRKRWTGF